MIPRANIIAFHKDGTVRELAELMVTRGHSRIPIYGDSLDDILGIIHIIDLAKCLLKGEGDVKVEDVVNREVKFVSPSMRVLDLLRDMQANKIHMAMVIDEYGGIDGLVTIEDLLEEIVGDIEDEYDFEEQHVIMLQDEGLIIADARAELEEIKEAAHLDLCKILTATNWKLTRSAAMFSTLPSASPPAAKSSTDRTVSNSAFWKSIPAVSKSYDCHSQTGQKENGNVE